MSEEIIYVDMDGVLVDFEGGIYKLSEEDRELYKGRYDEYPGFFLSLNPMPDAIESFKLLFNKFDVYILSSPCCENPSSYTDKFLWVEKWLPYAKHKLILSKFKNLNKGSVLIDDRLKNGADKFEGLLIHFGTKNFPNWASVIKFIDF